MIGERRRPLRRPFSSRTLTLTFSQRRPLPNPRSGCPEDPSPQPSPPGEGLRGGCADQRDVPTGGTEPGRPLRRPSPTVDVCVTPGMVARKTLTLPSPPGEGLRGGALLVGLVLAPTVSCKGTSPGRPLTDFRRGRRNLPLPLERGRAARPVDVGVGTGLLVRGPSTGRPVTPGSSPGQAPTLSRRRGRKSGRTFEDEGRCAKVSTGRDVCVTWGRLPGRPSPQPSPPGEGLRGGRGSVWMRLAAAGF